MADTEYHFRFFVNELIDFDDKINPGSKHWKRVERFSGTEGMSRPFHFEIYLAQTTNMEYDDALIGRPATLIISRGKQRKDYRCINGLISRFLFLGYRDNLSAYYAELVPSIWLLSQNYQSRIFQDMTVPEIIEKVLDESPKKFDIHYSNKLHRREQYSKREYCAQYRESDFDFISRLMEEEGIFYSFEHQKGSVDPHISSTGSHPWKHTLVLGNEATCYSYIQSKDGSPGDEEKSTVKYMNQTGLVTDEEHVYDFSYNYQVLPGQAILRDYDYTKSNTITSSSKNLSKRFESLKFYDYPGKFDTQKDGDRLAQIRIEEKRTKFESGGGHSNCMRLVPGSCFTLAEHKENKSFNTKHLLLSVSHTGRQATATEIQDNTSLINRIDKGIEYLLSYVPSIGPINVQQGYNEAKKGLGYFNQGLEFITGKDITGTLNKDQLFYGNQFECIPGVSYFRPPRRTPKPVIQGPQTAMVVGQGDDKEKKKKKLRYMDELGRAKVLFHWDRREKDEHNCSCWIRVASNYAGQNHGTQFHPLIGDEVVVVFLEGDPDRPLIVGSVYNKDNPPPLKPEEEVENIILTPYQHRLLFDDHNASITLDTGGGENSDKKQKFQMFDEDPGYGNLILLKTSDGHSIHLQKGKDDSRIGLNTEQGHNVSLLDSPASAILLRDKTKNLTIKLDSDNETILIENDTPNKIVIICPQGNVSVIGGIVEVTGSQSVSIKSDVKVSIEALMIEAKAMGSISLTAPMIKLDAPMVTTSGVLQVGGVVITPTIVATTYTPGAGNLV